MQTQALIDTGSPATFISLPFLLDVLATERDAYSTSQEWKEAMAKCFEPPGVTLHDYGGDRLNVIGQIRLTLSQGDHSVDTYVFIQKSAPHKLLLGTDSQSALGFCLLLERSVLSATDLLTDQECEPLSRRSEQRGQLASAQSTEPHPDTVDSHEGVRTEPHGVVRLLQATKVPPGYWKVVRATVGV